MADATATARAAWQRYVETLGSLQARITESPEDGYWAGEGLEHVVRQTVCWSEWEALHADPTRPFFQRQLDIQTQWGGPNNDNVYRHARISPNHRYRIRGRTHSCEDFVLAVRAGFFHNEVWGTRVAVTASELGIHEGEDFEILLGGEDEGAIPLADDVIVVSIREYYMDWRPLEPAVFTIECLDPPPPAVKLEVAEIVRRVDKARSHIVDSMEYWHDYMENTRAKQVDNEFPPTMTIAKGLSMARYENCYWSLASDEALIIEASQPDARYWNAQVYIMDVFDLVDRFGRITSRNNKQTQVSDDGRVRWVLSAEDPGVANWLDTGERPVGLCMLRWFWPRSEAGFAPRTRVVKTADVRAHLPDDEPTVTSEERAAELARRQDHMRWRFRI
jgi:hypothetical protein